MEVLGGAVLTDRQPLKTACLPTPACFWKLTRQDGRIMTRSRVLAPECFRSVPAAQPSPLRSRSQDGGAAGPGFPGDSVHGQGCLHER